MTANQSPSLSGGNEKQEKPHNYRLALHDTVGSASLSSNFQLDFVFFPTA